MPRIKPVPFSLTITGGFIYERATEDEFAAPNVDSNNEFCLLRNLRLGAFLGFSVGRTLDTTASMVGRVINNDAMVDDDCWRVVQPRNLRVTFDVALVFQTRCYADTS
jgi:hypothetical protein